MNPNLKFALAQWMITGMVPCSRFESLRNSLTYICRYYGEDVNEDSTIEVFRSLSSYPIGRTRAFCALASQSILINQGLQTNDLQLLGSLEPLFEDFYEEVLRMEYGMLSVGDEEKVFVPNTAGLAGALMILERSNDEDETLLETLEIVLAIGVEYWLVLFGYAEHIFGCGMTGVKYLLTQDLQTPPVYVALEAIMRNCPDGLINTTNETRTAIREFIELSLQQNVLRLDVTPTRGFEEFLYYDQTCIFRRRLNEFLKLTYPASNYNNIALRLIIDAVHFYTKSGIRPDMSYKQDALEWICRYYPCDESDDLVDNSLHFKFHDLTRSETSHGVIRRVTQSMLNRIIGDFTKNI